MKTNEIQSSAKQILKENYNLYYDSSIQPFRKYVELEAQSDPHFFHWLFNEVFDNDYDTDLRCEQKKMFETFLNSL